MFSWALTTCWEPCIIRVFYEIFHLILIISLWRGDYYYFHFIGEKNQASVRWMVSFPQGFMVKKCCAQIQIQVTLSLELAPSLGTLQCLLCHWESAVGTRWILFQGSWLWVGSQPAVRLTACWINTYYVQSLTLHPAVVQGRPRLSHGVGILGEKRAAYLYLQPE